MWRAAMLGSCIGCAFHPGSTTTFGDGGADSGFVDAALVDASVDAAPPAPFAMAGQRWLLPCLNNLGNRNCNVPIPQIEQIQLQGSSAERWTVTIRIRGVMEAIGYNSGQAGQDGWYAGGLPNDLSNNIYRLDVSSPLSYYWLNRGTPTSRRSFAYDYMATIDVDGDATLTFTASGQDALQWGNYDANGNPITLPGVTTNPQPYDGQFAQLDVISATLQ